MDAEELLNLIKSRRAVMPPQYSDRKITDEELRMILESANWAPSHKRTEPGRYRIIRDEGLKRFSEFMGNQYEKNTATENFSQRKKEMTIEKSLKSDKIILICVKYTGKVPEWEETASVVAGVQNMWLMCTALGIGSYLSTPATISKINEFTELEEAEKCIGIFYMGKLKTELMEGHRQPIDEKIRIIDR